MPPPACFPTSPSSSSLLWPQLCLLPPSCALQQQQQPCKGERGQPWGCRKGEGAQRRWQQQQACRCVFLISSFSSASCRAHPCAVEGQPAACHCSCQPRVKAWQCMQLTAKATVINPAEARPGGDADLAGFSVWATHFCVSQTQTKEHF